MSASQLNSIDIDVGGTFTDLVMNVDGHTVQAKVPTTPYDLSDRFRSYKSGSYASNWHITTRIQLFIARNLTRLECVQKISARLKT